MKKRSTSQTSPLLPALSLLCVVALIAGWALDRSGIAKMGASSGQALSALRISEVQNHNAMTLTDDDGAASGWIELQNTGAEPISLRGVCLMRSDKLNRPFEFPNATLEPGAFVIVFASGSGTPQCNGHYHAPFRLPKSGGTELLLADADQTLIDRVEVPAMQVDESLCRDADGSWTVTEQATPGAANLFREEHVLDVREGEVAINEVMTHNVNQFPDEDGDCGDYVELRNTTGHPVNLSGYWLSDNAGKPAKWQFPDVTLPAGGCLAVHCSGKNRKTDPAHLHTSFRLSEDETLSLTQPGGAVISAVTLPKLDAGQALSWADGWTDMLPPTPNLPNTFDSAAELDARALARLSGGVYISEIMAAPADDTPDWVELYNSGSTDADLSGFGLSDRLDSARRWQFPQGTSIPGYGRLAVFLVGANGAASKDHLTAPFALPADGGCTVSLCDPGGRVADALFLPGQYPGIAYGRGADGALGYLADATPLKPNGAALKDRVEGAEYSRTGGLFKTGDRFSVTLSAQPGDRIYYTLDCTDPDETKTLYTGNPIEVSGTTILRTRVYRNGCLPSLMDAQSYLYDVQAASEVPYVVSLVSDPDGLYSDERGIMVMGPNAEEKFPHGDYNRGANFWMEWEREAHVEVFTGAGDTAVSQECGIKLHGRNTRAYELKCFKVMAKNCYGDDRFRYPLFHERPYDEYEAFLLRYSGQDYKYTFMRDVVMTNQAKYTSVMYMESEECICYLNGEYYSAMYIRENVSPFSIARREGWTGQEDAIDLVKSGKEAKQGSNESYAALKVFLETHDNNTQAVYDRIAHDVDIDNFIQFITLQVVYGPPDTVNVKRYRNTHADGKWRWVVYDFDRGLRGGADSTDGFELMAQGTNAQLFKAFMANDALRERFLTYLNEALSTFLSSDELLAAVDAQYERTKPMLPQYLSKMGISERKYNDALKSFKSSIRQRPALVLKHCATYLHFTPEEIRSRFPEAVAKMGM